MTEPDQPVLMDPSLRVLEVSLPVLRVVQGPVRMAVLLLEEELEDGQEEGQPDVPRRREFAVTGPTWKDWVEEPVVIMERDESVLINARWEMGELV